MAIAHVCQACGTDLARCRPVADPHYGLPLLQCPGCGEAAVRRRHPISAWGRGVRRTGGALLALAIQLAAVVGFAAITTAGVIGLPELVIESWHDPDFREARWILLVLFGVVGPIAIGAWLTSGLRHWHRALAWAAWTGLIAVILGWIAASEALRSDVGSGGETMLVVTRAVFTLPVLMTIAMLGIPLGIGLVHANEALRRRCRRGMRRRRRRHRATVGGMTGW